jgi:glycosyltransferase involved in cell wall biosynthesis
MSIVRRPKIFYVGDFLFPDGDAGAHRVYAIGKALSDAGYEVVFLGAERTGRPQDISVGDGFRFEDFSYYPSGDAGNTLIRRALRLWRTHLSGQSTMSRLKALWTDAAVAVFAYQASSPLLFKLRRFCDRNHAVLVADVVEWYDPSHVTWGRFGLFALDSELRMRIMHKWADGVVAISSYLKNYYQRVGKPSIRVPALVDVQSGFKFQGRINNKAGASLKLVFVGRAGKKDYLVNAIRGLALLGEESRKWELVMVGPSRAEILMNLGADAGVLLKLNDRLRFVGSVSHAEALDHLRQADFSVMLRPDLRFAHAGFPTKLVESLAMGVPVICNLTSDIGLYVQDGQEGLVVTDCSPESFAIGLQRAMEMSLDQRIIMRANARRRAEISFDYRNWSKSLGDFVHQLTVDQQGPKK